ncbi:MAG TPA: hypothetical protein DCX07_01440 [Phycisphaerales bacterium]|nr:hypothetical protein [Phycisphaerales bacterium]
MTLWIDDASLPDAFDNVRILRRFGRRKLTHVFHDVDGTHSLIRDWPPVMSRVLREVVAGGLPDGYDADSAVARLVGRVGVEPLEETDRFCVESAGLSALTQMEWAIRRGIERGSVALDLPADARAANAKIVRAIWEGRERFDDVPEPESLRSLLREHTPRLFRLYERVLNGACRDRNLAAARRDPLRWRVPGAMEFMEMLHAGGVKNYFVTGAVIPQNAAGVPEGGMFDEILAVGFRVGPGELVEALHGSTWSEKIPKDEVMRRLCRQGHIDPSGVLVVGDGRSEISAGVEMGAVAISRLPVGAARQRQLHEALGTHVILADYTSPRLREMFVRE